jgi:hypothetical protein
VGIGADIACVIRGGTGHDNAIDQLTKKNERLGWKLALIHVIANLSLFLGKTLSATTGMGLMRPNVG